MNPKCETPITLRPDVQKIMTTYTFVWRFRVCALIRSDILCESDMIVPQPAQKSTLLYGAAIETLIDRQTLLTKDRPGDKRSHSASRGADTSLTRE